MIHKQQSCKHYLGQGVNLFLIPNLEVPLNRVQNNLFILADGLGNIVAYEKLYQFDQLGCFLNCYLRSMNNCQLPPWSSPLFLFIYFLSVFPRMHCQTAEGSNKSNYLCTDAKLPYKTTRSQEQLSNIYETQPFKTLI